MYFSILISIVGISAAILNTKRTPTKRIHTLGIPGIDYIAIEVLDDRDQGI